MIVLSLFRGLIEVPDRKPSMREIAERVAAQYELSLADLRGPTKPRKIAHARQEAMAKIYAQGGLSNAQVGRFFGGRDHTTVVHARQQHARRVAEASGAGA